MRNAPRDARRNEPIALHDRAIDNLRFIRETMESATTFTAVPGWGGVAMGCTALVAAWVASQRVEPAAWLRVWLVEGAAGAVVAAVTLALKARRGGTSLLSGSGRRFALGFTPPIVVAVLLTVALARAGTMGPLPGVWMLLYGTGVVTAGAYSVPVVPVMGSGFMVAGALALFLPGWGNVLMAASFGGLHVIFGFWIARRHGG